MKQFEYQIRDELGIHARPAGMLVKKLQEFSCDITLTRGEKTVNAKKLFAVMGMAVKQGETITITADGDSEDAAIEAARQLITSQL